MTRLRVEKVNRMTADIPDLEVVDPSGEADLLILGWGPVPAMGIVGTCFFFQTIMLAHLMQHGAICHGKGQPCLCVGTQ